MLFRGAALILIAGASIRELLASEWHAKFIVVVSVIFTVRSDAANALSPSPAGGTDAAAD